MFVGIYHTITDAQKFGEASKKIGAMVEGGKLPQGIHGHSYLPSVDGRKAFCLWEVDTLDNLRRFIDTETTASAKNEYFQIKTDVAFGLPGVETREEVRKAA